MPLTPFHWGPSSWIGLLLFKRLDFATFMVATVIVDIEPFCVVVFGLNSRMHGYSHTFLFGSIIAFVLAWIMYKLKPGTKKVMSTFRLGQDSDFRKILFSSIAGVWLHILLDAPLYTDIRPFFPLATNPLYDMTYRSHSIIYTICKISFLMGLAIYFYKIRKENILRKLGN